MVGGQGHENVLYEIIQNLSCRLSIDFTLHLPFVAFTLDYSNFMTFFDSSLMICISYSYREVLRVMYE